MQKVKNYFLKRLYNLFWKIDGIGIKLKNDNYFNRFNSVGKGCRLNGKIAIDSPECVTLGNNVHIGDGGWIRAGGGLIIGDNTHIARNVVIYTENHNIRGEALPYDNTFIKKRVSIGANVWIGMNVCIAPGSQIGDGVVVGMGTTVSGKIPPLSIVAGQKYRIINNRDKEHYDGLIANLRFGGVNGKPIDE